MHACTRTKWRGEEIEGISWGWEGSLAARAEVASEEEGAVVWVVEDGCIVLVCVDDAADEGHLIVTEGVAFLRWANEHACCELGCKDVLRCQEYIQY